MTKDNEARVILIGETLYSFLKKVPTPIHDNHVFPNNGKRIEEIREGLGAAYEKAGIVCGRFGKEGFVFRDLRHTFVTNVRKAGVPRRDQRHYSRFGGNMR